VTAHVRPVPIEALAMANAWFAALGKPFRGSLEPEDPLIAGSGTGWLVSTLGRELAVVVDPAFPFTRPNVYLRGVRAAMPHVERNGRLCLRNPEVPSDPAMAMASALSEARDLLRAIDDGAEDGDFQEDFGLYCLQQAAPGPPARLLLPERVRETRTIAWVATNAAYYGFASTTDLRRWWQHRFSAWPTKVRQGGLIALERLPEPNDYPNDGEDLWSLVQAWSPSGATLLAHLLRQTPKSLLVVLAGTAPSGRRHAFASLVSRPQNALGKSANRRVIEHGHKRGKTPASLLCERYIVTRLVTEALDAAGSRLPYAERDRLTNARVGVIGCGALGSGVARLLAKSGIGHLVLVDPEELTWENIRRHQLGAGAVGMNKADVMAQAIPHQNPDIGSTKAYGSSVEALLTKAPAALDGLDLVVACTATWSANSFLDAFSARAAIPILYAWMERHAVAAHAVLIMPGHSFASGYDPAGNPKLVASASDKPIPAECGGLTSPFGAIELAQAEALTGRLALDFVRGKAAQTTWRTWLTDDAALAEAEGRWTPEWIAARGKPSADGGTTSGPWWTQ